MRQNLRAAACELISKKGLETIGRHIGDSLIPKYRSAQHNIQDEIEIVYVSDTRYALITST